MLVKIIITSLVILFILLLIVKRFVYFHPTFEFYKPIDTYDDIYEKGLHAWFKKPQPSVGKVILFCHGNAGNISHRQEKIAEFTKKGYGSLIFDYSGFGRSKGIPSEETMYSNASVFMEFLLRTFPLDSIVLYGESMGCAVAAYTARKYQIKKLILESPLPSISTFIKYRFPRLSLLRVLFPEFDTLHFLKGFQGEILTLHSVEDEVIPFESVQHFKLIGKFVSLKGSHNNPGIDWGTIFEFLQVTPNII